MNQKKLALVIALILSVNGTTAWAAQCPDDIHSLSKQEQEACLAREDSSTMWWWIGGGTLVAAGVAIAAGGGGGGGGGGDGDDDDRFDDYDDYYEYYARTGTWPPNTPQSVIDAWNAAHPVNPTPSDNVNPTPGDDTSNTVYFHEHATSDQTGVSSFTFAQDNGKVIVDTDSTFSGVNQRAVWVKGQSVEVDVLAGTTTTATRDATSIYITGKDAVVNIAGKLVATGDDASVIDIEGINGHVTLQESSEVNVSDSGDGLELESSNARLIANGKINVSGWDSTGISASGNNVHLTIGNTANINVSSLSGTWRDDDVTATAFDVEGNNLEIVQQSNQFYVGANATGIHAETEYGGSVIQSGTMTINGTGATGIELESEGQSNLVATNSGTLNVKNGGTGMYASGRNAQLINTGDINVHNSGNGMSVGSGATAINRGRITLTSDGTTTGTLSAMSSRGNSTLINDTSGVININASGAQPFVWSSQRGDTMTNYGKIYASGVDVTNNYQIGTVSATQTGVLQTSHADLSDVTINTGFTQSSDATNVTFDNVVVGEDLSGAENIRSTSVVWAAEGYKDSEGNVDVTLSKKSYDSVVTDASVKSVATELEQGYTNNALYNSLNQSSTEGLNQAMRAISGQNAGQVRQQTRVLDRRFDMLSMQGVTNASGFSFNAINKNSQAAELANDARYDMISVGQTFTAGSHQYTFRYGLARLDGENSSNSDSITGGYSQFLGIAHRLDMDGIAWQNRLDASVHQLDSSRAVRYSGVSVNASGDGQYQNMAFTSALSKDFTVGESLTIVPTAGLRMRYQHSDAMQEDNAGDWNLHWSASDKQALDSLVGVDLRWQPAPGLIVNAAIEGGPNLGYKENAGSVTLQGAQGARFAVQQQRGGQINGMANVGVNWSTEQTQLRFSAWKWQEDGDKDKGLTLDFSLRF
ncbi:autotransporter domain-containing protein [Salmonella enterica subsp. enterica serovar Albuquerque]|nr:autotransporter domain-containing protein [Salmonella enterica subsp. enterica serovar Albuquerque]